MKRPDNISLPFFAYGIFKPGQLCYSRIGDLVENKTKCSVNGYLKERDGIPLLILGDNYSNIKGYLIHFILGKEPEAYDRIISIEPDEVYRWDIVKVDNKYVNVLVGKKEKTGSSDLEHIDEWDGSTDPFFKQGIEIVEEILEANQNFDWDFKALLRLQMAYMLLWSSIERYAGLKYHLGKDVINKVFKIAEEDCFVNSLRKNVRENRSVHSTTKLDKYILDPSNPKKSIKYYYQVRSNVVHRGKAVVRDFDTIKNSLVELLAIFKELLKESFRQ